MKIQLTAKHLKLTPAIREYVQQKTEKAQKYFDNIIWGQVVLFVEKRAHKAEVLIHAPGQTFRALASAADLYSAIDLACDKIDAQLKKHKERLKDHHQSARVDIVEPTQTEAASPVFSVVRHPVEPTTPEEAVTRMEEQGYNFLLYLDAASRKIQAVFRRSDETYGIIQPIQKGKTRAG